MPHGYVVAHAVYVAKCAARVVPVWSRGVVRRGHARTAILSPEPERVICDAGGQVPAGGNRGVSAFTSQLGLRAVSPPYRDVVRIGIASNTESFILASFINTRTGGHS